MKKYLVMTFLLFILMLSSCNQPPDQTALECTDNQIRIDDTTCRDLLPVELQLRSAVNNTKDIEVYQMDITISGDEQQTEMIIKIADYISQITLDDHVNQYRYLDGVCEQQYIYQQTLVTETVDCQDNNQFLFIKQLDYTWFELNQGTYQLRETYIGSFQDLIESGLPSFIVESVTLSIADQYVSGLTLSLTKNTLSYNIQIHISKIDNVTLMWGEINE